MSNLETGGDVRHRPDYHGGGIVNLMASVVAGLGGGETGYAPAAAVAPERLAGRPVVLFLLDGLGDALLERFPDSHLARHRVGRLTSVFPSTTASAVTTFATAVAPQQHAVTGWFTYFRELGSVAAVLPFRPRHGGGTYGDSGITPADLVPARPLYPRLTVPSRVLNPVEIAESEYSRFSTGGARRVGHRGLEAFFAEAAAAAGAGPGYCLAYWSDLDRTAHRFGIDSREVAEHFRELDAAFGAFLEGIAGSGALVLATADHGLVDTDPLHALALEDHPRLAATLALPLCGDPRAAFCYVRPGREADFLAYVEGELGDACTAVAGGDLVADGWFGRGTPSPRLAERAGDYVLLMGSNYVLHDRLPNERAFTLTGVHGGTSAGEMFVPLCVAEP